MRILEANGITLSYESFGEDDAETILLIAGLGTQMIRWTVPFCENLTARGYRVIRFDNRDAGCSTHFTGHPAPDFGALAASLAAGKQPDVPYTLYNMAADAIGLLDALAIDRAHFVGRSMGGMIAQIAASEHPRRVLSLTSIMSSTGNPDLPSAAPDVMAMMTRRGPNPMEDETGFLEHGVAFARRIASPRFPFDGEAHSALMLEETRRAYDPTGFGRQIGAIAVTGDRRPRLACITAPTLVMHGADDPLIPSACGKDTASSIPHAEFTLIEGMGTIYRLNCTKWLRTALSAWRVELPRQASFNKFWAELDAPRRVRFTVDLRPMLQAMQRQLACPTQLTSTTARSPFNF